MLLVKDGFCAKSSKGSSTVDMPKVKFSSLLLLAVFVVNCLKSKRSASRTDSDSQKFKSNLARCRASNNADVLGLLELEEELSSCKTCFDSGDSVDQSVWVSKVSIAAASRGVALPAWGDKLTESNKMVPSNKRDNGNDSLVLHLSLTIIVMSSISKNWT